MRELRCFTSATSEVFVRIQMSADFTQAHQQATVPKTLSITISAEHVDRIREMFRQVLGRDLTLEEEGYLGLSSASATEPPTTAEDKSNPGIHQK